MLRLLLACVPWLLAALPALGQGYPSRPIRIIVPFAPGASADGTGRAIGQELGARFGQSVVIENNAGGGGVTGLQQVARSAPDGHTLGIGAAGAVSITPLMPGAPAQWDPAKDLQPVARIVNVPLVLVAHPTSGPKTLAEALAKAKASPDGMTFGSTGTNSGMHLAVEYLSFVSGAKLVHVPYRGSAPAVMDAVAGQVPFVAVDLTAARPQIEAGKVTALALISDRRVSLAPEVPSLGELGFPGYESQSYLGLLAPMGMPAEIIKTLQMHIGEIVAKPEFVKQMNALALEPAFLDAAGFTAFLEKDRASWRVRLKAIGKHN